MATHNDNTELSNRPYEQNLIGLRGIVFFGVGLFLLIVVTFALMWAFQSVLEDNAAAVDAKQKQPMSLKGDEKLPPEPRLQAAPGFKVDGPNGPVNLELTIPQAEYREIKKMTDDVLKNGQKVNDTVVVMPIEEAEKQLLEQVGKSVAVRAGEKTDKAIEEATTFFSYASSGRKKIDKRK